MGHPDDRDPAAAISAPVRLSVRCPQCGHSRTTVALHDGAVAQARRCPHCEIPTEVLDVRHIPDAGCACCT